jgi:two-component system, LytTR family, response regulator
VTSLRILIVDDEPLAREGIRQLLATESDVTVVGEYADGVAAVEAILRHAPDLVFLDVQMPVMDGFGVLEAVGPAQMPAVIFVTAYDAFAVRAFDVHALDYLLKPLDPDRFRQAMTRARSGGTAQSVSALGERLAALLEHAGAGKRYLERIAVKEGGKITIVRTRDIDWIEAEGDYICVHALGRKHLVRNRISALELQCDPAIFARIHRSTIVNIDRIRELQPLFSGEYALTLQNGTKLTVSRSYRDRLFALLHKGG